MEHIIILMVSWNILQSPKSHLLYCVYHLHRRIASFEVSFRSNSWQYLYFVVCFILLRCNKKGEHCFKAEQLQLCQFQIRTESTRQNKTEPTWDSLKDIKFCSEAEQ